MDTERPPAGASAALRRRTARDRTALHVRPSHAAVAPQAHGPPMFHRRHGGPGTRDHDAAAVALDTATVARGAGQRRAAAADRARRRSDGERDAAPAGTSKPRRAR